MHDKQKAAEVSVKVPIMVVPTVGWTDLRDWAVHHIPAGFSYAQCSG